MLRRKKGKKNKIEGRVAIERKGRGELTRVMGTENIREGKERRTKLR